ncbi:unnamed protein product [Blepharisma stoltei]|uniref:Choline transporter-like protein n=1 Tax=Blepharisma stoltei TaxID=1481888 RepID=A0AAU9K443_9CILI|nr:unnamed protein product [Blepharisma stoltei]
MTDYKPIPELKAGPVGRRRCTDCLFCIAFSLFIGAMVTVAVIGFENGDPYLLIYPHDSSGFQCGRDGRVTSDYKYLYYPSPIHDPDYKVCVKHCPKQYNQKNIECYPNRWVTDCTFLLKYNDTDFTPVPSYQSQSFLKRFCIPDDDDLNEAFDDVMDIIYDDNLKGWATDIYEAWTATLIVLGVSIVVSIIYLGLLRYCVGVIVWCMILACLLAITGFAYFLYHTSETTYSGKQHKKTREAIKIASYIMFGAVAVFLIFILFMYKRIRLAIAIMKSGAIFLKDAWIILLVPVLVFVFSVGFFCYWILSLVYIYSSGGMYHKDEEGKMAHISWDESERNSFYFELVAILWVNSFKVALVQFIIACSVCIWYFSETKGHVGLGPICRSTYYAFRYHLGSLAFGSFLLALIRFVKWYLVFLRKYVYKQVLEGNKCVKFLCGCVACYVSCLERFIKFINKNAYIQIALTGDSFCVSARHAFICILENAARFAALGSLGEVFSFLGKVLITAISSFIGYMIITQVDYYEEYIENPLPPTIIFIIVSYLVAGIFMSVYEMTCDTILQAFLIDEKLNPYSGAAYAPKPLQVFMTDHRKGDS